LALPDTKFKFSFPNTMLVVVWGLGGKVTEGRGGNGRLESVI
jgi:hypothetical protein